MNGEPGGDACRYMGCGTLGGINTMANAHVNFHFNAKLAREVVPVEVVDQRFLLEAERSNYLNLTLASLEKKEYEPLPAVPAVDDFCSSWAVQSVTRPEARPQSRPWCAGPRTAASPARHPR